MSMFPRKGFNDFTFVDAVHFFSTIPAFILCWLPIDRVKRLLHYAATLLPPFPDSSRIDSNRVMDCSARVWLDFQLYPDGKMRFFADSDSEITRGFCACLVWLLDGGGPEDVVKVTTEDLTVLNVGLHSGERSRVNTVSDKTVNREEERENRV